MDKYFALANAVAVYPAAVVEGMGEMIELTSYKTMFELSAKLSWDLYDTEKVIAWYRKGILPKCRISIITNTELKADFLYISWDIDTPTP